MTHLNGNSDSIMTHCKKMQIVGYILIDIYLSRTYDMYM